MTRTIPLFFLLLICEGCKEGPPTDDFEKRAAVSRSDLQGVPITDRFALAKQYVERHQFQAAEELLRRQLVESPTDIRSLELLGDLYDQAGNYPAAVSAYEDAVSLESTPKLELLEKLGTAKMKTGCAYEAFDVMTRARDLYPNNVTNHYDVAGLSTILGLPEAAIPSLKWLVKHDRPDPEGLIVLADPKRVRPDETICRDSLDECSRDIRGRYGLARLMVAEHQWSQVTEQLWPVVRTHPEFLPAYTLLGRSLVIQSDDAGLAQWASIEPEGAKSLSEYWLAAGLWADRQGRLRAATKAYLEALRCPNPDEALLLGQLSKSLRALGMGREADLAHTMTDRLAELRATLDTFLDRGGQSQSDALAVALALRQCGRLWEAEGWARYCVTLRKEPDPKAAPYHLAIRRELKQDSPWRDPRADITERISVQQFGDYSWKLDVKNPQRETVSRQLGRYRLEDQAVERNLQHTCHISDASTAVRKMWIFQTLGGGLSVIDFDLDGWPDIAAGVLDGRPLQRDSGPNHLYRNQEGIFQDVTVTSQWVEDGFSQGMAIGDYNQDGFDDIYVGNIGENRLYRNNGDGTFQDVTDRCKLQDELWTSSSAIADFNGDGLMDIYQASYASGETVYELEGDKTKRIKANSPLDYPAQSDRIWRGKPDGTFVDSTIEWMPESLLGRGLGLIVGQIDGKPGLDAYVANDMTVNHLWVSDYETSEHSDASKYRLTEVATGVGLAVNGQSFAQASMGVAAADADNDGDLDFFLTHFFNEYNTFYEQVQDGLWTDNSLRLGFGETSNSMLGFGTEWIDLDNNGELELLVANGHINRFDDSKTPFEMPAQLLWRNSEGRWLEDSRTSIGEYFQHDHLGRALATLDVDLDGRVDVGVSHIFEPISLLMNRSEPVGNSIGIFLKSTAGARDSIGTTLRYTFGSQSRSAQLLAGGGFHCSSQKAALPFIGAGNKDQQSYRSLAFWFDSGFL